MTYLDSKGDICPFLSQFAIYHDYWSIIACISCWQLSDITILQFQRTRFCYYAKSSFDKCCCKVTNTSNHQESYRQSIRLTKNNPTAKSY